MVDLHSRSDDLRDWIQRIPGEDGVRPFLSSLARRSGNALLIAQKPKILKRLLLRDEARARLPDLFGIYGVPTQRQVRRMCERCAPDTRVAAFVGDLSPVSLATWMILAAESERIGLGVSWAGIRESWIHEAVELRLSRITIPMPDAQRQLWAHLKSCAGEEITSAIGSRCVEVLDGGSTLELDALANVNIFSTEEQRELVRRSGLCDRAT